MRIRAISSLRRNTKRPLNQEIVLKNTSGTGDEEQSNGYFSYFVDQVIRDVVRDLVEQTGYSAKPLSIKWCSGGYSIYCTLNPEVQKAVDTIYENLENIPQTASNQQPQSAITIVDNMSGDIVANGRRRGREGGEPDAKSGDSELICLPGSTIKPLTVTPQHWKMGLSRRPRL